MFAALKGLTQQKHMNTVQEAYERLNKSSARIKEYDFRQPKVVFSKDIIRVLNEIHEELTKNLGRFVSSETRVKAEVSKIEIKEYSSAQFLESLSVPQVLYQNYVTDVDGNLIIQLPREFCMNFIEKQSGGAGKFKMPERPLTMIEEKIISRFISGLKFQLLNAWQSYASFEIERSIYESKPELLTLNPNDTLVIINFEINFGETVENIVLAYTSTLLKGILTDSLNHRGEFNSRIEELNPAVKEGYHQTLLQTPVSLKVLLGSTKIKLSKLMSLSVGDIISLRQKKSEPLDIRTQNKVKMRGYPGVRDGFKAIKIVEVNKELKEKEIV